MLRTRIPAAVRAATPDEWAAAYVASRDATFFHGPRWSQIVSEYAGDHRPAPVHVEGDDGLTAVLGITTVPTGLPGIRKRLVSPEGCCGGWCAADRPSGSQAELLARILSEGDVVWRIGPHDAYIPDHAVPGARLETTHLVDLRGGAAAARATWKPGARRGVGRAERAGVTVRTGQGADDWDTYRLLYRRTVARWSSPLRVYDDRLFEIVPRVAADEVLLLLAERNGEPCAGAIVFLHGQVASGWHSALDPGVAPGAMNALHWEAIEALERCGVGLYDLLGSGPLAGVVAFKESIGGVPHPVRAVVRSTRAVAVARAAKRRFGPRPSRT